MFPNLVYYLLITLCRASPLPRIIRCLLCLFLSLSLSPHPLLQTFLLRKCIPINVPHYGLDGTGIECQWAGLSAPIQSGPGTYPASYSVHTVSFLGVNWSGHGTEHPSPSSHKVKERVLLYLYSGLSWAVLG